MLLQRGYATGDLSLVYPLARGTGPIFATAGAIAILGERPGPIALAGTAAIAVGVVLLLATRGLSRGPALAYAVLTGPADRRLHRSGTATPCAHRTPSRSSTC